MDFLTNKLFKGNKRSVTVKKNIYASLLIKGCSIVISLLLVPLTLGYVSSELYGVWLTLSSVLIWLNFFDIGFTLGLKNKLAEAIALKDWNKGKKLVSTTYFMMVVIFIPLFIILELLVPLVDWSSFLNVSQAYNEEIVRTLHLLVACFCLQMIVNVLLAVVAAFQKVALSTVFPVIGNFLSLLLIYILTRTAPPSLVWLGLVISVMPVLVTAVASFILFRGNFKKVSPSFKCIARSQVKDLFNLGFQFFIIQIQAVVLYQTTNILISRASGADMVTSYNIAYKYLGVAMMIYTIILAPLWPAFTDAYTKKDFEWMNGIYRKMVKLFLLSVLCLGCMITFSARVYHLWIGDKASVSFAMTLIVGLYVMIYSWNSLQVSLINGIGAIRLQTCVTVAGMILYLPLALFLGKLGGGMGVIYAMIAVSLFYSLLLTVQIRKILNRKAVGIWIK